MAADNGAVIIDSFNIAENPQGARQCLSYCPRNNVLFKDLSVEEHLVFFAVVRLFFKIWALASHKLDHAFRYYRLVIHRYFSLYFYLSNLHY